MMIYCLLKTGDGGFIVIAIYDLLSSTDWRWRRQIVPTLHPPPHPPLFFSFDTYLKSSLPCGNSIHFKRMRFE